MGTYTIFRKKLTVNKHHGLSRVHQAWKKPGDANKARPLKVIFQSEEEKLTLVKKYCITKREGSAEQKKSLAEISIVPDRTIKEREEYKKLNDELEERTQNGEKT